MLEEIFREGYVQAEFRIKEVLFNNIDYCKEDNVYESDIWILKKEIFSSLRVLLEIDDVYN